MKLLIITTILFLFHVTLTLGTPINFNTTDLALFEAAFEAAFNSTSGDPSSHEDYTPEDYENDEDTEFVNPRREVNPDITCSTSKGSPLKSDVLKVSNLLLNRKNVWSCKQKTVLGSSCTRLEWSGTAAAAICGDRGHKIDCRILGRSVKAIADKCGESGRAGGTRLYKDRGGAAIVYAYE